MDLGDARVPASCAEDVAFAQGVLLCLGERVGEPGSKARAGAESAMREAVDRLERVRRSVIEDVRKRTAGES